MNPSKKYVCMDGPAKGKVFDDMNLSQNDVILISVGGTNFYYRRLGNPGELWRVVF